MKRNLICVHHGNAYDENYVKYLWAGVRRNTLVDFDFYVFTNDTDKYPQNYGWKFIKLPIWPDVINLKPWWYKMEIFNSQHQLEGSNLYIDIDTVVVGDVECFWNWKVEQFRICHDFNRAFHKNIQLSNSSVMGWHGSSMDWLYKKFSQTKQYYINKYRGDQDLIHAETKNGKQTWWPREWAMSWKWEIAKGKKNYNLDPDTKIMVFHGSPNPHEVEQVKEFWH